MYNPLRISVEQLNEREGIDTTSLAIYGQESKDFVWKMCKMNLAIRGTEGDIRIGDSYHDDKFFDLRADYVVSNPPFNDSGWDAKRVRPEHMEGQGLVYICEEHVQTALKKAGYFYR